jgi:hypothetical protein
MSPVGSVPHKPQMPVVAEVIPGPTVFTRTYLGPTCLGMLGALQTEVVALSIYLWTTLGECSLALAFAKYSR